MTFKILIWSDLADLAKKAGPKNMMCKVLAWLFSLDGPQTMRQLDQISWLVSSFKDESGSKADQ